MSVSPYELLCLSKPRKPAALVTPYDLYSQSQQQLAMQPEAVRAESLTEVPASTCALPQQPTSTLRTHYISDIQKRHSTATRRTAFSSSPIP